MPGRRWSVCATVRIAPVHISTVSAYQHLVSLHTTEHDVTASLGVLLNYSTEVLTALRHAAQSTVVQKSWYSTLCADLYNTVHQQEDDDGIIGK